MNTRREMAIALLGLPLMSKAAQLTAQSTSPTNAPGQTESQTNLPAASKAVLQQEHKPEKKQPPPPLSVDAATIISYTLYAEARGESVDGKMAVASVIKTRAIRSKKPLAEVCMQDRQFSCWNNLNTVPEFYITGEGIERDDLKARGQCFGIAWVLLTSNRKWDHLTHFYNPDKVTPDWGFELKGTRIIGRHVFGYID